MTDHQQLFVWIVTGIGASEDDMDVEILPFSSAEKAIHYASNKKIELPSFAWSITKVEVQ